MKKILTLDDLFVFCESQKFYKFSAQETGYQLVVQTPSIFEVDHKYDDQTLLFGNVKLFHIGENRNQSSVTKDAATKALPTIAYKPLLANFCEIDGEKDFTSHDVTLDENGNFVYLEKQIGCFTADPPEIRYDDETQKEFVFARVAIPREYTDACEIIERKGGTKISVEFLVNEMQYSAKDKILELTDVIVSGATCLGKNPDTGENVEEGMKGAYLNIEDFSAEKHSTINHFNNQLVETLDKIHELLSSFKIEENSEKGGAEMELENVTPVEETAAEDVVVVEEERETEEEVVVAEDEQPEGGEVDGDDEPEADAEPTTFSRVFEISHDDIRCGLYRLLDAEGMNCWISQVFDKYFIADDWREDKSYKQSYSVEGDNITLVDDRVQVYHMYVTDEEKTSIEEMRTNYAALKQFKDDYDAAQIKTEKDAIFANIAYSEIKNSQEFKDLQADMDKYSVEEISTKCDLMFAAHQKTKIVFEETTEDTAPTSVRFNINTVTDEPQAYAGLFSE